MSQHRVLYLFVWGLGAMVAFWMQDRYTIALFTGLTILPMLSGLTAFLAFRGVHVRLVAPHSPPQKGQPFTLTLLLEQKAWWLCPYVYVSALESTGVSYPFDSTHLFQLGAKQQRCLELTTQIDYCGTYLVGFHPLSGMDFLQLFYFSNPTVLEYEATIFPRVFPIDVLVTNTALGESHTIMPFVDHSQNTDVMDFKVYNPAVDDVRNMHWKLSAQTQQWMVKQYHVPQKQEVRVALNLLYESPFTSSKDAHEQLLASMARLDEMLDTTVSVLKALLGQDKTVLLSYVSDAATANLATNLQLSSAVQFEDFYRRSIQLRWQQRTCFSTLLSKYILLDTQHPCPFLVITPSIDQSILESVRLLGGRGFTPLIIDLSENPLCKEYTETLAALAVPVVPARCLKQSRR